MQINNSYRGTDGDDRLNGCNGGHWDIRSCRGNRGDRGNRDDRDDSCWVHCMMKTEWVVLKQ